MIAEEHILPNPTCCDVCSSPRVGFRESESKFKHKLGRKFGYWMCFEIDCRAAVSCHPQTHIPMGYMARRETRELRSEAHDMFDRLWGKGTHWTRAQAYEWLCGAMLIPIVDCHIARMEDNTLLEVIQVCAEQFKTNIRIQKRRRIKAEKKELKRYARERQRTGVELAIRLDERRYNTTRESARIQRARTIIGAHSVGN